tara:strand:+ start:210 stop:524 length:315 start_codon:yes stop_codon:yes gene_type:complete
MTTITLTLEIEVEVRILDEGKAPKLAGPPGQCDPGDPPEWEIVAVGGAKCKDLDTAARIAEEHSDTIHDAVCNWLDEHAGEPSEPTIVWPQDDLPGDVLEWWRK